MSKYLLLIILISIIYYSVFADLLMQSIVSNGKGVHTMNTMTVNVKLKKNKHF